jgi:spore coat polysaccharide biosynthesis protein SpsF
VNLVVIIQARMGSTRLPGKVLKDICGQPMLARVINRVCRASLPNKVVVATSTGAADDVVADLCAARSIDVFRGSELDVLDRYYQAARAHAADAVVRITSDCPLLDPEVMDRAIRVFFELQPDYASNGLVRTYPRGLDTEVMSMAALRRAWQSAREPYQRMHVTPYIYQNPAEFKCINVASDEDYSAYRWTVDTAEDLDLVRAIYDRLGPSGEFGWRDVLALMQREPALVDINRDILQKSLEEG